MPKLLCDSCEKRAYIFTHDRRRYCSMAHARQAEERDERERARARAAHNQLDLPVTVEQVPHGH